MAACATQLSRQPGLAAQLGLAAELGLAAQPDLAAQFRTTSSNTPTQDRETQP